MSNRKGGKKSKVQQIFEQGKAYQSVSQSNPQRSQHSSNQQKPIAYAQQQEGEIIEGQDSSNQIVETVQQQLQALNKNNQNAQMYQDSSDEDNDRLEQEKKKREQFWKNKHQKNEEVESKKPLTEAELLQIAFAALQKTNKKVMLMRKKNQKRMQDLDKIRMAQQPYLTASNTHFRGSTTEYSILTHDTTGKTYYHPNHSFRVGQMRLQNFILKNIKEESTANYLNQVVKFENYAYQQRKKRRHNIQ